MPVELISAFYLDEKSSDWLIDSSATKGGYHRSHAQENPYQIRTDLILCTYEIRRFFEGGKKNDGILSRGVGDGCC